MELNGQPRMKLSQDLEKVLIPGRKSAYRLYGMAGWPLLDLLIGSDEVEPKAGERTLCRHPFVEQKRVAVIPSRVEKLHSVVFDKERGALMDLPSLSESAAVRLYRLGQFTFPVFVCASHRGYSVDTFLFKNSMSRIRSSVSVQIYYVPSILDNIKYRSQFNSLISCIAYGSWRVLSSK